MNQQIKIVLQDFMLKQGDAGLQKLLTSKRLMAFLNTYCKLYYMHLAVSLGDSGTYALNDLFESLGIGVHLVLMITGKVA